MIQFCNADYETTTHENVDLFICSINFEKRSYYIFDQIVRRLSKESLLVFATDNCIRYEVSAKKISEIEELGYTVNRIRYHDYATVIARIESAIQKKLEKQRHVTIVVDYSSMPRSWYTRLPGVIERILRPKDIVYFWYSEGNYPADYSEYPTAGTDKAFEFFSGKASLLPQKRTHIFALSYDTSRTQGIIEKCEPEYVIVCEAHDPARHDIRQNIIDANENLMSQAAMVVSLDISDFSFMLTKLREIVKEQTRTSDVVIVPDGPKPLILAMSLIPDLIKENGITCIHAKRDLKKFVPVDVTPSGKVVGFSLCTL